MRLRIVRIVRESSITRTRMYNLLDFVFQPPEALASSHFVRLSLAWSSNRRTVPSIIFIVYGF
jgi:hypothetical protein